jgi:phage terminase small subunit
MKLTDKQKRFCEEYLVDFNGTQAAIRAGYSKDTAYSIGSENLRKPELRQFIDERIKGLSLSSEETLKAISDIAKSSLNDYFITTEQVRCPQIEKPLKVIINEIKAEIEDADKFIVKAKITNSEELSEHNKQQEFRRRRIIKLQIDLERDPNATQFVEGRPQLVKVAELDIVKLVNDKEAGRIKSVKHTEHGLNVEMYPADAALSNLAKIHGLFEKDNKQKNIDPATLGTLITINKVVTNNVRDRDKDNTAAG